MNTDGAEAPHGLCGASARCLLSLCCFLVDGNNKKKGCTCVHPYEIMFENQQVTL